MLKKITLVNEGELFTCEKVDTALFQKKYPQLYESCKDRLGEMGRDDIEEILPDNDSFEDIVLNEKAVSLHFENGETTFIYNKEIICFNGLYFDGFSVYADSAFVYFLISVAAGQAGSLGIWSLAEKRWVFTHRDEGLCVEAIIHLPDANCFIGFSEWHHWGSQGGEFLFFINSSMGYSDMEINEIKDFNWELISPEAAQEISARPDATLFYDQPQAALYRVKRKNRVAYRLNDARISVLQNQVTSPD